MALTLHPVPGKAKSKMICDAFATGAPKDAQGHVFYGVTEGNADRWRKVSRSGEDFYFIDNSYFDVARGLQFRVTKNRIQHQGTGVSDGKRFDALGITIAPPRLTVGCVLAVEQSPLFMSLVAQDPNWLDSHVRSVANPRSSTCLVRRLWSANKLNLAGSLHDDLCDATLVVTHSSAAAVEAVLAGVRVLTSRQSAAWSVPDDRRQWASVLADNQFELREMKEGYAWSVLQGRP